MRGCWYDCLVHTHSERRYYEKKNIITDMQCDGMDGEHI